MKTVTHRLPGLLLTDHTFNIPLDHAAPDGEKIEVFAREVVAARPGTGRLPWLVFLQGGPGFASPRPTAKTGWLKRALRDYRVLLLDQRGTGRSTPVTFQTLAGLGTAQAMADYLKHFRSDAIVQAAEWIRRELLGQGQRWSVLGQSYGGFCVTHYLSAAPQALHKAFLTGGLPPLERSADEVYRATYRRVIAKNQRYYERYHDDADRARGIVDHVSQHDVRLPSGDRLSTRRFQQLGLAFGASDGFEQVHYLLEEAFVGGASGPEISYGFLHGVEEAQKFETNPIYAILQEACYTQGAALRAYEVPCAAAVYYDDMYVERAFLEETAQTIRGLKVWVTNEYEHNGLRASGRRVLGRLIKMLAD